MPGSHLNGIGWSTAHIVALKRLGVVTSDAAVEQMHVSVDMTSKFCQEIIV